MPYNPAAWYWVVDGSTTQVYSSAGADFVPLTDATYLAWAAAGNRATAIDSTTSLQAVLGAQYPAGWPQTLAQRAQGALEAPYSIVSPTLGLAASTPYPAGVPFAIDAMTLDHIGQEMIALLNSGGTAFVDGTATVNWPDAAAPSLNHTWTVAEFKTFALLIGAYVAAFYKCINGTLTALPASSVTIA
jgi:hypothetical protein